MDRKLFSIIKIFLIIIIISLLTIFLFYNLFKNSNKNVLEKYNSININNNEFITIWKTDLNKDNIVRYSDTNLSSKNNIIKLPLVPEGKYNFEVCWGDGTCNKITKWNQKEVTHVYKKPGIYVVRIKGKIDGWSFGRFRDYEKYAIKLIYIKNWGSLNLGNDGKYFLMCINLKNISSKVNLNLSNMTNFSGFFEYCLTLKNITGIFKWDTSKIKDMSYMFSHTNFFNQPLNNWNVSSVTNMAYMFEHSNFNQPIDNWNVKNVKNMNHMFSNTNLFNQPLNNWDVSNVKDMSYMFNYANIFNKPLNNWNVSNVKDMSYMFHSSTFFNQDISNWNTHNVKYCKSFSTDSGLSYDPSYLPNFPNCHVN